jgi:hypothetical protein
MTDAIVTFQWKLAEVGKFKTGTFEPLLNVVAVTIPEDRVPDYLISLPGDKTALTPAGVRFCYLQLHDAMSVDPADMSKMYNAPETKADFGDESDYGWSDADELPTKWDE